MMEIAVAGVAGLSAILVALVERGRRQNSREHGAVIDRVTSMEKNLSGRMDRTDDNIDRLADKIDGHIGWHLEQKEPTKTRSASKKTSSQRRSRPKMTG